jgi:hypothetical protein
MKRRELAEILFTYAGERGHRDVAEYLPLAGQEAAGLKPWIQVIERINASMTPVQPSAAFVQSLGRELRRRAGQQIAQRARLQRTLLIGAAVGSIVSVASVAGAIAFVLLRRRGRAQMIQGTAV